MTVSSPFQPPDLPGLGCTDSPAAQLSQAGGERCHDSYGLTRAGDACTPLRLQRQTSTIWTEGGGGGGRFPEHVFGLAI